MMNHARRSILQAPKGARELREKLNLREINVLAAVEQSTGCITHVLLFIVIPWSFYCLKSKVKVERIQYA